MLQCSLCYILDRIPILTPQWDAAVGINPSTSIQSTSNKYITDNSASPRGEDEGGGGEGCGEWR